MPVARVPRVIPAPRAPRILVAAHDDDASSLANELRSGGYSTSGCKWRPDIARARATTGPADPGTRSPRIECAAHVANDAGVGSDRAGDRLSRVGDDAAPLLESGADDHMVTPYHVEELLARSTPAFARSGRPRPTSVRGRCPPRPLGPAVHQRSSSRPPVHCPRVRPGRRAASAPQPDPHARPTARADAGLDAGPELQRHRRMWAIYGGSSAPTSFTRCAASAIAWVRDTNEAVANGIALGHATPVCGDVYWSTDVVLVVAASAATLWGQRSNQRRRSG